VTRRRRRRAVVVAWAALPIAVAILAAEGGGTLSPPDRSTPGADRNPVVFPPGRLVAIGGGRTLYLRCTGSAAPTVILESGTAEASEDWLAVQGPLSRVTRTCAYDRAGAGNSLPAPGVSAPLTDLGDLRKLAAAAKLPAPYVLVGASYGGLLAALYARTYPHDTAGLVMVDAIAQSPSQMSLGAVPLVVITRGRSRDTGPPRPQAATLRAQRAWVTRQDLVASLSTDSVHVTALRSGYGIWPPVADQPDVLLTAVRAVVQAARTRSRLPSCASLFRAAGTSCAA
jgi:pimeloyl-ACP methyl ester carboxylesterase